MTSLTCEKPLYTRRVEVRCSEKITHSDLWIMIQQLPTDTLNSLIDLKIISETPRKRVQFDNIQRLKLLDNQKLMLLELYSRHDNHQQANELRRQVKKVLEGQ